MLKHYSEHLMDTEGFEMVLIGMSHLIRDVPLNKKCRVVLEYDPAESKVKIETFTDTEDNP